MTERRRMVTDVDQELDFLEACRILWRYKFMVATAAMICGLIAAFFAYTAVPIYRAEVVVSPVSDRGLGAAASLANQLGGLASLAGASLGAGDSTTREAQAVLQSKYLTQIFIEREHLLGLLFLDSKGPHTLWRAVQRFSNDVLNIRDDARKGITTISMDWVDPTVAARWANGYVAIANEIIRKRALNESSRNIAYLNSQVSKTSDVAIQRALYNLLESETKTLMLANGRVEYAFSTVDPAVPPEVRIKPKRIVMILIGVVIGTILGSIVAFVRNGARERGHANSANLAA